MARLPIQIAGCLLLLGGCAEAADPPRVGATPGGSASSTLASATSADASKELATVGEWPNWRGPRLDGISRETDWNATWPEAGPKQAWKASIGTGFASFSVSKGLVYTMGHVDGFDVVWCLDAADGRQIWKHTYAAKLVANLHEGGPACTPTVDGDRVYTVSKEGHLFCLDAAKGTLIWRQEFEKLLGVSMPDWGFSCSPLVHGDLLIIEAGRTAALDKKTGELRWQTEKYRPGYGSAVAWRVNNQDLITVLNNEALLVLRAKDGSEVDKFRWETSYNTSACTPIVSGNTVFISTGYNRGCALFDLADGKLTKRYESKNMRNHMANCVLHEGYLYGVDGNSHQRRNCSVVCLKYDDGKVAWKKGGYGCGTVLIAGDNLVVLSDEGDLVTAPVSIEGFKPISKARVIEGRCWTVPVLAAGRMFVRNAAGDMVCLDLRK